jgi:sortase B
VVVIKKTYIYKLLIVFFALLLSFSSYMVAQIYIQGKEEQAPFDQLADSVISQYDTFTSEEENSDELQTTSKYTEYLSIYKKNNDFVCWINIDGTLVNYPVMYTPDDPQYYLRRAFDKSDSQSGTPFVGEGGNIDSDCFIIYGHNMKNDSMFGTLDRYKEAAFYTKVSTFTIVTPTERRTYEVFAAIETDVSDEEGLYPYNYSGSMDPKDYDELTNWLLDHALYDTGVSPSYGEQIVLLSTCSYHTKNGRFVVAARRIS